MEDYTITENETIRQSDIDLVREMNLFQKNLRYPFDAWPEWAKSDAQKIANYRRQYERATRTA